MATEESFEQALYRAAEQQIEEGHYFLAVVIAQVAVEAVAEAVFLNLLSLNVPRSAGVLRSLLPDRSFRRKTTRRLWAELTGDDISADEDRWTAYNKHLDRRNRAVHGSIFGFPTGDPVSEDEARNSIRVCREITDHIFSVMDAEWNSFVHNGQRAAEEDSWRALRVITSRPYTDLSTAMGGTIRKARDSAGMTMDDLAEATGVHPTSLQRIEDGWLEPSLSVLVKLAPALSLTVAELVERSGIGTD